MTGLAHLQALAETELVQRLRAHANYLREYGGDRKTAGLYDAAAARLTTLEAENKALREALEPFAEVADAFSNQEDDTFETWRDCHIPEVKEASKLLHFRRARAALTPATGA